MIERNQDEIMLNWNVSLDTPMVSIRCIAFNQVQYISDALDSFLLQRTDFPFEIVVHDDASTDGTAEIIRKYEKKYPKIIKAIYEKENQYSKHDGSLDRIMSSACRGKFVAICEGDDYWIDPLKLQKQVDYLESHPNCGLVRTDINRLFQKTGIVEEKFFSNKMKSPVNDSFEDYIWYAWFTAPCTWMYRNNCQKLPLNDARKYHIGALQRLLFFASQSDVHFMNEVSAVYRVLDNSASHFAKPVENYRFWCRVKNTRKYFARKASFSFRLKFFFYIKIQHIRAFKSLLCASLKQLLK